MKIDRRKNEKKRKRVKRDEIHNIEMELKLGIYSGGDLGRRKGSVYETVEVEGGSWHGYWIAVTAQKPSFPHWGFRIEDRIIKGV